MINFLNKEFLVQGIFDKIYEDSCFNGERPGHIKYEEELHDIGISIKINNITIEEYDMLYWNMCSIIQVNLEEMIDEINSLIDEECVDYYGDPAFSSASDYWSYILG